MSSGQTSWTLNRNQVITGALRKLAVLPSGGTPTSAQISDADQALNALIKAFNADGMPLWKISTTEHVLTQYANEYTIGPGTVIDVPKPLKLIQAFWEPSDGTTRIPLNIYNRYDFLNLPQSTAGPAQGTPINLYYQPLTIFGRITLWPIPNMVGSILTISYTSLFEDMLNSTDEFDFPSEWIQALIYNLAWALAPEYGIPPTDRKMLADEAKYWHEYALSMGSEDSSLYLQPNRTF